MSGEKRVFIKGKGLDETLMAGNENPGPAGLNQGNGVWLLCAGGNEGQRRDILIVWKLLTSRITDGQVMRP